MTSTRTSPEWRDDMPRTFSSIELPPHVEALQPRRRRLSAALILPRMTVVSARR